MAVSSSSSSTCVGFWIQRDARAKFGFNRSSVMGHSRFPSAASGCSCNSTRKTVVLAALGFGKRPETKAKPKILKELDVGKVDKTETFKIFARKVAGEEALTKWEKIGEILIESGANIQIALKERKPALVAGVRHQHPVLMILQKGEELQYGIQQDVKEDEASKEEQSEEPVEKVEKAEKAEKAAEPEIVAMDLSGKQAEETVPAILRVDDGKPPGKSARRF